MAKRFLTGIAILSVIVLLTWAGFLYRKYLRGIYPAVLGPARNVAALLNKSESPLSCPAEFELSIFADGLSGPRVIAFDPAGTMLVSMPSAGKVAALPDIDHDGRADRVVDVAIGLNRPHGIAFSRESKSRLYIAETDRVMAYDYDPQKMQAGRGSKIADLPGRGGHYTRTILFMPPPDEDRLLISVGSSCNVCEEKDWRRAKILVVDKDGGNLQTFASGLRNAVFMTVRPGTREIWATEMGRDYLGDDLPPDEINIIRKGRDYGWPLCYGKNIPDTQYDAEMGATDPCKDKTPSFIDIQAHSAPLGLAFFPEKGWPDKYRHSLLVAYHGSWNRTVPTGYKVVLFRFDEKGELLSSEDFISGWLTTKNSAIGRPVDIKILQDGVIFISDDKAGVIYRLALTHAIRSTFAPRILPCFISRRPLLASSRPNS